VISVGSISGVALAQTGSTSDGDSSKTTLLARVADILGIDQQKVEDAFAQAQSEMEADALDNHLRTLAEVGKITQEQADKYKSWWQSMPDMPAGLGFPGRGGFDGIHGFDGQTPPSPLKINQGTSQ
jgi:hypothetical protein